MAFDAQSTEIAALDDFPGAKLAASKSSGKTRTRQFSGCVASAADKTCELTKAFPSVTKATRLVLFVDSGAGTLKVGYAGDDDALGTGLDPASATVDLVLDSVDIGGKAIFATSATAAVSYHGWIEYSASA